MAASLSDRHDAISLTDREQGFADFRCKPPLRGSGATGHTSTTRSLQRRPSAYAVRARSWAQIARAHDFDALVGQPSFWPNSALVGAQDRMQS